MLVRVLTAVGLLLAALGAQPAPAQERKAALVIGNAAYRHVPALPTPANDAGAVANALRDLGFDVALAVDVDHLAMRRALDDFSRKAARADVALFYFAGHALNLSGENYLVPVNTRIATRNASGAAISSDTVALKSIFYALDGARAKIVILDASRDLPTALSSPTALRAGLAPIAVPPATLVMSATAPNAVVRERDDKSGLFTSRDGKNSLFTSVLAWNLIYRKTNVEAVLNRVRTEVTVQSRDQQVPWITSTLFEQVTFYNRGTREVAEAPLSLPARERFVRERAEAEAAVREREAAARAQQEAAKRAEIERALQAQREKKTRSIQVEPAPKPPAPPSPVAPIPSRSPADNAGDRLARFPTIEAAQRVRVGETTTVLVSLTVDKVTPEVRVLATGEGTTQTRQGALDLSIPADATRLPVKVVLRAPGFDLDPATPEEATIFIDRTGDSTSARFRITARSEAVGASALRVTFWRDNEFLASVSRKIEIMAHMDAAAPRAAPQPRAGTPPAGRDASPRARKSAAPEVSEAPSLRTAPAQGPAPAQQTFRLSADSQVAVTLRPRPIDLKIEVVYDDPANLGRGRVTVASDYLGNMRHGEINTAPSIAGWLEQFYREFRTLSSRGAQSADPAASTAREANIGRLRAFGEELYRRAAPAVLQSALAELLANPAVELRTVQVYSNNPLIPWELMRAPKPDGGTTDFFGIAFALARWHEDDGPRPILRPPQDQRVDEVVAVAPAYAGRQSLGAQSREIEELQNLLAARRVAGKRSDFLTLMRNPPRGIIHFAGHGEVAGRTAVERRFAIQLEDGAFDVMDWRGIAAGQGGARPLFFFNACDVGQAESVAGAVEGWAPAVLARGAAGYIGGLWPLKDDPAARFAIAFYRAVSKRLADDGRASVAAALADARRLVYETADPTYLGYAFYGDAQLALVR